MQEENVQKEKKKYDIIISIDVDEHTFNTVNGNDIIIESAKQDHERKHAKHNVYVKFDRDVAYYEVYKKIEDECSERQSELDDWSEVGDTDAKKEIHSDMLNKLINEKHGRQLELKSEYLKEAGRILSPEVINQLKGGKLFNKESIKIVFTFHGSSQKSVEELAEKFGPFFEKLFGNNPNIKNLKISLISCHSAEGKEKSVAQKMANLAQTIAEKNGNGEVCISVRGAHGVLVPISMVKQEDMELLRSMLEQSKPNTYNKNKNVAYFTIKDGQCINYLVRKKLPMVDITKIQSANQQPQDGFSQVLSQKYETFVPQQIQQDKFQQQRQQQKTFQQQQQQQKTQQDEQGQCGGLQQ